VSEGRSQKLRPLRASEDEVEVSFGEACERVSFARAVESYEVEQIPFVPRLGRHSVPSSNRKFDTSSEVLGRLELWCGVGVLNR
jgi:hypothetical protein